ncbi:unnamed protein product [Rhizoctonia solani]|uniref:Uncharacterized protein n=1 Tax=Rhizoctonia solani TaxID=456999 RepID=A0A8H3GN41_9AGAM|nr:unnamed protein product [Rhizoctonia solani]
MHTFPSYLLGELPPALTQARNATMMSPLIYRDWKERRETFSGYLQFLYDKNKEVFPYVFKHERLIIPRSQLANTIEMTRQHESIINNLKEMGQDPLSLDPYFIYNGYQEAFKGLLDCFRGGNCNEIDEEFKMGLLMGMSRKMTIAHSQALERIEQEETGAQEEIDS